MKSLFKKVLVLSISVVLVIGLTACSSKDNSSSASVSVSKTTKKYTEQEVKELQKSPDSLINAYYKELIPLNQSDSPDKEKISRFYSLLSRSVANIDKTEEVYTAQMINTSKKIFEKHGKLLDVRFSAPITNNDSSITIKAVEQYEKDDQTSTYNFIQKDGIWYIGVGR